MRAAIRLLALLLTAFAVCVPTFAAPVLTEKDLDGDGDPDLVFENRFFRLVVQPRRGGVGTSLIVRPEGIELLKVSTSSQDTVGGLFQDQLTRAVGRTDFMNKPFIYRVVKNDDTEAAAVLSAKGISGELSWLTIQKIIRVYADKPVIRVDWEYQNPQESMAPMNLGFWVHNQISADRQDNRYFIPRSAGAAAYDGAGGMDEVWAYDATDGWIAAVGAAGHGAVAVVDYKPIMCLYAWLGGVKTVEWMYRTLPIPAGGSFTASAEVIVLRGLNRVDGARGRIVFALSEAPSAAVGKAVAAEALLYAAETRRVSAQRRIRRLPQTEWKAIGNPEDVSLPAGQSVKLPFAFTPDEEGTYVLGLVVSAEGKTVAEFERPLTVGKPSAPYVATPREKRIGDDEERFGVEPAKAKVDKKDIPLRMDVATPHVPWARPYGRGPLKAFVLTSRYSERETIELAQRLEMDLDHVTLANSKWNGAGALVRLPWEPPDMAEHVKTKLTKNRYDVIILGDVTRAFKPGEFCVPGILDPLFRQVEGGAGLVVTGSFPLSQLPKEYLDRLPIAYKDSDTTPRYAWSAAGDDALAAAIPFAALPPTPMSRWQVAKPDVARVAAEARGPDGNKWPGVVLWTHGKGRIALLAYNHSLGSLVGETLTPCMTGVYHSAAIRTDVRDANYVTYRYWEYWLSLLARTALWAAQREPAVQVAAVSASGQADAGPAQVTARLRNTGQAVEADVEMTLRDEFYAEEAALKTTHRLPANDMEAVVFPIPTGLAGGRHFADVIVRGGGKSLGWGSGVFEVKPDVRIARIAIEGAPPFDRSSPLKGTVALVEPSVPAADLRLWVEDSHGQAHFVDHGRIELRGETVVPFEADMGRVETQSAFVRCEARVGGRRADRLSRRVLLRQTFKWDDYLYVMCDTPATNGYYLPEYYRQLRRMGVQAIQYFFRPNEVIETITDGDWPLWMGMVFPGDFQYHHNPVKERRIRLLQSDYQRTLSKWFLLRDPCVTDPTFLRKSLDKVRDYLELTRARSVFAYDCGDEITLGEMDFCWCYYCQHAFRDWVRRNFYRDVEAVNKQYGANYETWDDVLPLTFLEAKERQNYAGWADHRQFNETRLAEAVRGIRDEVAKLHPGAVISLSGTQKPGAYNGNDVWVRCQLFGALQAYGYAGQVDMHRSFGKGLRIAPWSAGYGASGPAYQQRQWQEFLSGASGLSFWWSTIGLNPDFSAGPEMTDLRDVVRPIQRGLGKLILQATQANDGVALHYSQSSLRAAYAHNIGDHETIRMSWIALLYDMGIQFRFCAYDQIEHGDLGREGYRVLILPDSLSLSEKEAKAIEAFANNGGTVIADMACGMTDEHCKRVAPFRLDGLFGVKRVDGAGRKRAEETVLAPGGPLALPADADLTVPFQPAEATLALDGGQALHTRGDVPAVVLRRVGKGAAVYLNLNPAPYSLARQSAAGKPHPFRRLMTAVLATANVKPIQELLDKEGKPLADGRVYHYVLGKARYYGLLRSHDKNSEGKTFDAVLRVASPAYLYEAVSGQYLGQGQEARVKLDVSSAAVVAALPYKLARIEAEAPAEARPGDVIRVSLRLLAEKDDAAAVAATEQHVVRVDCLAPSGEALSHFGRNLSIAGGKGVYELTLPLNATPGEWKLEFRDAATGVTAGIRIRVADRAAEWDPPGVQRQTI